jgi:hypothetical protein
MRNFTLVIPFYHDNEIRYANLIELTVYLKNLGVSFIVVEHCNNHTPLKSYHYDWWRDIEPNSTHYFGYIPVISNDSIINKSNLINIGIKNVRTKYSGWHDVDVRFNPLDYKKAHDLLEAGEHFIRPFNGTFVNIKGYKYDGKIMDLEKELLHKDSVGGGLFFDVETFKRIGGMNENFIGWGFEDDELNFRIHRFGFEVKKCDYLCYHIDHPRGGGISSSSNPNYEQNKAEYDKIERMGVEELFQYCDWLK